MVVKNVLYDLPDVKGLIDRIPVGIRVAVVLHLEAQDVVVRDGVGDGILVQAFLEYILGGDILCLLAVYACVAAVLLEYRSTCEAEKLGLREEVPDSGVILTELAAVTFVEDEDDAFVSQALQALVKLVLVGRIQGDAELLDGCNNDLVGIVGAFQATYEGCGVCVLFDAAFLEFVEFITGLLVEILAVHDEDTFLNVTVVFEQGRGLETGEGLAAAGGMPDVAVLVVFRDTVNDAFNSINLVGTHNKNLLLCLHEHHITANEAAEGALGEHHVGEFEEFRNFVVALVGCVIDGKIVIGSVEVKVLVVVIGKVHSVAAAVADDEELHETHQRIGVAVTAVLLVADNLFNSLHRRNAVALELNLYQWQAVDQDDDVVALATIGGIDSELVHHLIVILAPVPQVHKAVVEGGTVVPHECLFLAQALGGGEYIGRDVLLQELSEFIIRERDEIEPLEFLAEIAFKRIQVTDVAAVGVFHFLKFFQELLLELCFALDHIVCVFVLFRVQR